VTRRWQIRKVNKHYLSRLAQELSVPLAVARVLLNRGITTPEMAWEFLDPSLSLLEKEFQNLSGLDQAVRILDRAVQERKRIVIFGDYDVDGLTASVILFRLLRQFSPQVEIYLPNRFLEGYGVTEKAVETIIERYHPELLITVDCGIRDWGGIEKLRRAGISVILTDHHLPDFSALPCAEAIVTGWDLHEQTLRLPLSGAGVALALAHAYAEYRGSGVNPLEEYLWLACLGAIADSVPLLGVNRVIVRYGLQAINRRIPSGVEALLVASGSKKRKLDVEDLEHVIIPRLNAAGRVEDPRSALELFLEEKEEALLSQAQYLHELNLRRQKEEERVRESIIREERYRHFLADDIVVVAGENWNIGVLGIVATRLVDYCRKPVLVLSIGGDLAVGSGRSIKGFHLLEILRKTQEERGLLFRFGGHEMAVGLRLHRDRVAAFRDFINERFGAEARRICEVREGLVVDALLDLQEVNEKFLQYVERCQPFGERNPRPLFAALNVSLINQWSFGKRREHLGFVAAQDRGKREVVIFGGRERAQELSRSMVVDLAFQVERDFFSQYPYLKVCDWRIKK